jgi:hypothetical protein
VYFAFALVFALPYTDAKTAPKRDSVVVAFLLSFPSAHWLVFAN